MYLTVFVTHLRHNQHKPTHMMRNDINSFEDDLFFVVLLYLLYSIARIDVLLQVTYFAYLTHEFH